MSKYSWENKYGGERAKCHRCDKYNSDLYEFLKEDWRDLECSECHKSSPCATYFPKSLQKAKDDYQKTKGVGSSTHD